MAEIERSIDFTVRVLGTGGSGLDGIIWLAKEGGYYAELLGAPPRRARTRLDFFGTTPAIPSVGNGLLWGLYSDGRPLDNYGRLPRGQAIGTVEVPILTAQLFVPGNLELHIEGDQPISDVAVRIKGVQIEDPSFEAQRTARPPDPLRNLLGLLGVRV